MVKKGSSTAGTFRFNVSDAVEVPLRGVLLRLRLLDGEPSVKQLGKGTSIRLVAPDGTTRVVPIKDKSVTGGRNEQARLDKAGLYDVIIEREHAITQDAPVGIGWKVEGPVE